MASGRFGRCTIRPRSSAELYHNQSGDAASLTISAQVVGNTDSEITTVVGAASTTLMQTTVIGIGTTAGHFERFAGPHFCCTVSQYAGFGTNQYDGTCPYPANTWSCYTVGLSSMIGSYQSAVGWGATFSLACNCLCRYSDNLALNYKHIDGTITTRDSVTCSTSCPNTSSCHAPKGNRYGGNEIINLALGLCRRCRPIYGPTSVTVGSSTECQISYITSFIGFVQDKSNVYVANGCHVTNPITAAQLLINPCCNCCACYLCVNPGYGYTQVGMTTASCGNYCLLCSPYAENLALCSFCCAGAAPAEVSTCAAGLMYDWYSLDSKYYRSAEFNSAITDYRSCDYDDHDQMWVLKPYLFDYSVCTCTLSAVAYGVCMQGTSSIAGCKAHYTSCKVICMDAVSSTDNTIYSALGLNSAAELYLHGYTARLCGTTGFISPYGFKFGMTHCAFMMFLKSCGQDCTVCSSSCDDKLRFGGSCYIFGYPDLCNFAACRGASQCQSVLMVRIANPPTYKEGAGPSTCCLEIGEFPIKYLSYNPNIPVNNYGEVGCVYLMSRSACKEECGIFSFDSRQANLSARNNVCTTGAPADRQLYQCCSCVVRLSNNSSNPACNNELGPYACCGFFCKVGDFPEKMTCPYYFNPYTGTMCTSCIFRADVCVWTMSLWNHRCCSWDPFYTNDLITWNPTTEYISVGNTGILYDPQTLTACISVGSTALGTVDCYVQYCNCFMSNADPSGILDYKVSANNLERTGVVISNGDRVMVNNNSDECLSVQVWGYEG